MEEKYNYKDIDELLHSRIRLAIVSLLARCDEADFTYIRDTVGASDGNLTSHCRKLEEAEYISVRKTFIDRKPATFYTLTDTGKKALLDYAQKMAELVKDIK